MTNLLKEIMPVLTCVFSIFIILSTRPSILINKKGDKDCPYCLNTLLVTITVLIVGSATYFFINDKKVSLKL